MLQVRSKTKEILGVVMLVIYLIQALTKTSFLMGFKTLAIAIMGKYLVMKVSFYIKLPKG